MSARLVRAICVSTALAAPALAQTEQRTVKGPTVAIYNLAGRLRAIAGTGDAVIVEITRGGADASKLRVEAGPIGGRETLRIVYPGDRIVYPDSRSRTSMNVRSDGTFSDGSWQDFRDRDRVDIRSYGPGLEAFGLGLFIGIRIVFDVLVHQEVFWRPLVSVGGGYQRGKCRCRRSKLELDGDLVVLFGDEFTVSLG